MARAQCIECWPNFKKNFFLSTPTLATPTRTVHPGTFLTPSSVLSAVCPNLEKVKSNLKILGYNDANILKYYLKEEYRV
uniref:Uncharacterized protein n=1 Tax=Anguilla anguilla TaxID=7936 RepID=A0A0E9WU40_ANGAN